MIREKKKGLKRKQDRSHRLKRKKRSQREERRETREENKEEMRGNLSVLLFTLT